MINKGGVEAFVEEHDFVLDKIKERAPVSSLYRHPVVLAVYLLVKAEPDLVPKRWPFDMKHLEMFYADLGVSTEDRL